MLQARSSAAKVASGMTAHASKQLKRVRIVDNIGYLQRPRKWLGRLGTHRPNGGTLLAGKRLHAPGPESLTVLGARRRRAYTRGKPWYSHRIPGIPRRKCGIGDTI